MAGQGLYNDLSLSSRCIDCNLAEWSWVKKKGAAMCKHHLHVLLDAWEAAALYPLQKIADLHNEIFSPLSKTMQCVWGLQSYLGLAGYLSEATVSWPNYSGKVRWRYSTVYQIMRMSGICGGGLGWACWPTHGKSYFIWCQVEQT